MVEHDAWVGRQLDLLDELGIAEDTIVLYTTDNGAEVFSWPDGGCTPFRNEKNSMYDGAYRVPMMMRWPGHIPAGAECNGIISHLDLLPTLMAAAGRPNIKQLLLAGFAIGEKNGPWKACLDGYNMLPALTGAEDAKWPRSEFFYVNDQGEVSALRYNQYKIAFRVNEKQGFAVWSEIALQLKFPYVSNIRTDPYERYNFEPLMGWPQWMIEHAFVLIGAVFLIEAFERSVREWPPHFSAGNVEAVTLDRGRHRRPRYRRRFQRGGRRDVRDGDGVQGQRRSSSQRSPRGCEPAPSRISQRRGVTARQRGVTIGGSVRNRNCATHSHSTGTDLGKE